jgi:hypothetical protein
MNRGLSLAPRGMIALSTVMTDQLIDEIIGISGACMRDVAQEIAGA